MFSLLVPTKLQFSRMFIALAAAVFSLFPTFVHAQASVLTQHNDNGRTGANTQETRLTPFNVNTQKFGKLFTISSLEANVNGQPLYVPNVSIAGTAHNTLFAYTSNNTDHSPCGLWAFDADTGATLWHDTLPNSATYTTATPVIDPDKNIIYVLTKTDSDDTGNTYLHAFDIITGQEKPGSPIQVQARVPGTGDGAINGVVSFDGSGSGGRFHANDRPALLLLNGTIYLAFAHNTDSFPYHGWVLAYQYSGTAFTQTAKFCTTPNGSDGGIWMSGMGLTADADGSIYLIVGNGTFDADVKGITSGTDYSMCCLKLSPSLAVLDWFAPYDQKSLSDQDLDLGNSGLALIPGSHRLFAGGSKNGTGYLLNASGLGRFTPNGPDNVVLRLDGLTPKYAIGQNPVAWDAGDAKYVYLWGRRGNLEQFAYSPAAGTFVPPGIARQTSGQTAGGSLAVTANGTLNGIVWGVGYDAVVHAFDATDVSRPEFWNSGQNSGRDALGSVGHFQFPTVVNGKVYVPTGDAQIVVYGLLPSAVPPTHILWTNTNGQASVWNYSTSSGNFSQLGYGPYAGWTAVALADGPDGKTRLLWNSTSGQTAIWSLENSTGRYTHHEFGPYSGWTAQGVSVGVDNTTHVLWAKSDGTAAVWDYDTTQGTFTQRLYGPFAGWTARSVGDGGDGGTRLLWSSTSGQEAIWSIDNTTGRYIHHEFGPYSGWTARSVSVGPDNTTHLLWDNVNGQASVWNADVSGGTFTQKTYGPYSGWSAAAVADGPDEKTRLLWNNSDAAMSVWSLDNQTGLFTAFNFGPYSGWSAVSLSAGM